MSSLIKVSDEKCIGCGICVKACPFNAIRIVEGKAVIGEQCTLCGSCVKACPKDAISIKRPTESMVDLSAYKGVWIVAEQLNGKLRKVSLELLGIGRKLADKLGEELSAVLIGRNLDEMAHILGNYGADKVFLVENELLERYNTDGYTLAISKLIEKYKPSIVLFGATLNGRDLAPRVAARLKTGLTADCTGLDINEAGQLVQTRPAFGGNVMAKILCPRSRPQMATVRPNVMKPIQPSSNSPVIVKEDLEIGKEDIRTEIMEVIEEAGKGSLNIEEADIIVSAGRGIGSKENLRIIEELASVLNAAVGGSRAIVDLGWLPHHQQVGQTGKTVAPKIYFAIGISGAIQHIVGMRSSKYIIAVNKDPEAPIFDYADLGIVGDLFEIIPPLTLKLKQMMKEK